jgi:hypothetical protein
LRLLYTHTTCPEVTVVGTLSRGIDDILIPRLTRLESVS